MTDRHAPIRSHEDGSTELTLERPEPATWRDFWSAAIQSGLEERVCERCGQEWLTRSPSPLCPVCNPAHPGYEPHAPPEYFARHRRRWQERLLILLERRARTLSVAPATSERYDDRYNAVQRDIPPPPRLRLVFD